MPPRAPSSRRRRRCPRTASSAIFPKAPRYSRTASSSHSMMTALPSAGPSSRTHAVSCCAASSVRAPGRVWVSAAAPPLRYRRTLLRAMPSSRAMRLLPQPRAQRVQVRTSRLQEPPSGPRTSPCRFLAVRSIAKPYVGRCQFTWRLTARLPASSPTGACFERRPRSPPAAVEREIAVHHRRDADRCEPVEATPRRAETWATSRRRRPASTCTVVVAHERVERQPTALARALQSTSPSCESPTPIGEYWQ